MSDVAIEVRGELIFLNTEVTCDCHKSSLGGMMEMQARLEQGPRKKEPELTEFLHSQRMFQPVVTQFLSSSACPWWWLAPCLSMGYQARWCVWTEEASVFW